VSAASANAGPAVTPAAVIAELQARGVTLEPRGEKLAVRPMSRVTPGERAQLRTHKAAVLAFLTPEPLERIGPGGRHRDRHYAAARRPSIREKPAREPGR
jgi:hypothetical protein